MDNFKIEIVHETEKVFFKAFEIVCSKYTEATHYSIENNCLIFYWTDVKNSEIVKKLPFSLKNDQMARFAFDWLKQAEYPRQPDHDGINKKGYVIYNESWSQVGEMYQAFIAIKPMWVVYGK